MFSIDDDVRFMSCLPNLFSRHRVGPRKDQDQGDARTSQDRIVVVLQDSNPRSKCHASSNQCMQLFVEIPRRQRRHFLFPLTSCRLPFAAHIYVPLTASGEVKTLFNSPKGANAGSV